MQELSIAVGRSRKTKVWRNQKISWPDLIARFSETARTLETYKEYCGFTKEKQSEIKDNGGFVGGYLKDGKRSPGTVTFRQIITLDLDLAELSFWQDFCLIYNCEAVMHTTHKHSKKSPRYRLIIPLARYVDKEQYEAIARKIAGTLDMELFDPTTFQPERLMYWPTTSKDGVYDFRHQTGTWLSPDKILGTYVDWQDISEWPMHSAEKDFMRIGGKQAGVPAEKPGLVGAFCRMYNIHEAIAEFLSDIYAPTANDERYSFIGGQGAAGAIVYGEAEWLYSQHGTDPAHLKLLNSWDLVRIHKFGYEDGSETELSKQKSQKLMQQFAAQDNDVVKEMGLTKLAAHEDFSAYTDGDEEIDFDWIGKLSIDNKTKEYATVIDNFYLIVKNDTQLKGRLRYNAFSHREGAQGPLPWNDTTEYIDFTDGDDAALRHYVEQKYGIYHVSKSADAIRIVFAQNTFHPIRDYINALQWDGRPRVETMFPHYLGAENTEVTRTMTRKWMVAAIARIFNPGCKFDYAIVLQGPQGIGKSKILGYLGHQWFSDSFLGVEGSKAYEQLQGIWIMEIGELAGIRKADVEPVKTFISKRIDIFRVAYGKRSEHFARQCVFAGTTNEDKFLKDQSGNRRYWIIVVNGYGVFDVDELPVDQLWAEAKFYYDQGETLYLAPDMEEEAREVQANHMEVDERAGIVGEYLSILLPKNWPEMDIHDRRRYLDDKDKIEEDGEVQRLAVCVAEIWTELFRGDPKDMHSNNTKYIHQILSSQPKWEKKATPLTFPIYGKQRAYVYEGQEITGVTKRKAKRI